MAWWNLIPALTPLAVFDSDSTVGANGWEDRSGLPLTASLNSQKVLVSSTLNPQSSWRRALIGANGRVQYSSPVPLPVEGLFIAFVKPSGNIVLNSQGNGGSTFLLAYDSEQKWYMGSGSYVPVSTGRDWQVVAVKWDSTDFRIYASGGWVDVARPFSARPSSVSGMVYDNNYNLNGALAAHGLFSGTATLADIQAIDAELMSLFQVSPPGAYSATLPRSANISNPLALNPGPPPPYSGEVLQGWKNIYQGGSGTIQGTTTIENIPGARQVRLYDKHSGLLVAETWSSPVGHYEFNNIDSSKEYFVVAHDHLRVYNGVISDMLNP
jgi:hypothetical protein